MSIHPTAVVDPGAKLGAGVVVGPYAVIEGDVEVGEKTRIGPHVVIHPHTRIGKGCEIHAHAVVGDTPQDLVFKPVTSFVEIGDDCVIREAVTIHRGTKGGTKTVVGRGCYLMANSHLAHNVELGEKVILANGVLLAGYVVVGDGAFLSGNCVVHQFVRIGRLAMLGGLSAIGKDVPPFCMTRSGDVNLIVGLNVVGLRRAGFAPEQRKEVRRAFDLLYRSGLNVSQALKKMKAEFTEGPALEVLEFVEGSERGICAKSAVAGEDD
ncbi:MAG TPA: acyl-ACP--UDP-N-acetylglucosamine O-acyltransferase [Kiritimatiellia bacterium]|nr:acyl-ACP--UDP-N-acetylglucosamine O-acyltransferase [Kiritimatiellia bacterium]